MMPRVPLRLLVSRLCFGLLLVTFVPGLSEYYFIDSRFAESEVAASEDGAAAAAAAEPEGPPAQVCFYQNKWQVVNHRYYFQKINMVRCLCSRNRDTKASATFCRYVRSTGSCNNLLYRLKLFFYLGLKKKLINFMKIIRIRSCFSIYSIYFIFIDRATMISTQPWTKQGKTLCAVFKLSNDELQNCLHFV